MPSNYDGRGSDPDYVENLHWWEWAGLMVIAIAIAVVGAVVIL
jgi:hypothetical protein